jgi:hypothetical protein
MHREASARAVRGANIVLAGGGVVCLGALVYVFYHHGWNGERQFINPIGSLVYYGIPAVASGLCFASLRLLPALKVNLALVLFSAVSRSIR